MIVMIMMIVVIIWFVNGAKKKGKNEYVWAAIGALSFYLPVAFFGFYLFPFLKENLPQGSSETLPHLIHLLGNVLLGFLGVMSAMTVLRKGKERFN